MRDDRSFARAIAAASFAGASFMLAACSTWRPAARHNAVIVEPTPVASAQDPQPNRIDPFPAARGVQFESSASAIFPAAFANAGGDHYSPGSPQFYMYGELPSARTPALNQSSPYENTSNVRQISFSPEGADFDPVISRDGNNIYFTSTQHAPTADIYVKSVKGSAVTQLTNDPAHDVMPAVSPDGTKIAFASNRNGTWDIYVMNADGGQAVQITSDAGQELHPSWSPDGRRLCYCRLSTNSDRWEVWMTEVENPVVSRFLTYGLFPEWHPVENRIVFQKSRDRGDRFFSLWTVDIENAEAVRPTEVATSPVAAVINPTWSPDGAYIAFATVFNPPSNVSGQRPEYADIWIMASDGSMRTNLTGGWYVNLMPTWGADNSIYFISDRNGHDNIWAIGPEQAMVAAGRTPPTNVADVPTEESDRP